MSKLSRFAAASPFAHFLGLTGLAARAEETDDDRKQGADESDDDYAKRMNKLDEDEAKRAEEEKKKEEEAARKAEDEKKEEEARAAKRAAKAKREAENDDDADDTEMDEEDDDEDKKREGRAQGARQRERIRCARILAAGVKAGRVNQACAFAFDTTMTAKQAVGALAAGALDVPPKVSSSRSGLLQRMESQALPNPGASGGASPSADPAAAAAAKVIAAGERARGG